MRVFFHGVCGLLAAFVGWLLVGACLPKEGLPEDGDQAVVRRLSLERGERGREKAPHRLSMVWLLGLDQRLATASVAEWRALEKEMSDWPMLAQQLAKSLWRAHGGRLAPEEVDLRPSPSDHAALAANLFAYGLGSTTKPPEGIPEVILERVRQGDWLAVLEAIDHKGERVFHETTRNRLLRLLAESDVRAALNVASGFANKQERLTYQGDVMGLWAEKEPEAAMAWLADFPQGRDRSSLGERLLRGLDPRLLLEEADRFEQIGYETLPPRSRAIGRWMLEDAEAAYQWLKDHPELELVARAAQSVATEDPELATRLVGMMGPSAPVESTLNTVMEAYLREDREAALAWARAMPDARHRSAALLAATMEMASQEPERAAALLAEVSEHSDWGEVRALGLYLARIEDRQPGLVDASGLVDHPEMLDAGAMSLYVDAVAKGDPAGAAALYEEIAAANTDPEQRPMTADDLLRHWVFEDADAASVWLAGQSENIVSESTASFFNEWKAYDPEAALDWVEATLQPGQQVYNRMRQTVGGTLADLGRYAEALEAYQAVPEDQKVADHRWRSLFSDWHRADAEAAREGFEATGLPPERWEAWVTP